ncbi:MAG: FAD:protein FMN transferase [Prolixibacteraceae bacterium]|nr:FAD:protein FMN transferase [Prolixibacteraceae bacterium]
MYKHLLFLLLFALLFQQCEHRKQPAQYITNDGLIYGTYYHIVYESTDGNDLHADIREALNELDLSVSTFKEQSVLSKVNTNQAVVLDSIFLIVFNKSQEISRLTQGAFDPTVAPLVNAWGFGFKKKESVTPALIDSIRAFVGYRKVHLENGQIIKDDPRIMLDFSAIAKGYAVDVVGKVLAAKGCKNYMVDIGGEVMAHGLNREGNIWRIGINEPNDNEPANPAELQAIIALKDKAVATSGNYRNFYVENGKKYAHTIDPFSGYPVDHTLLSATVLADDCMTADALATALMVLGVDKALNLAQSIPSIEVFLIYHDDAGENSVVMSRGFEKYILEQ